MMYNIKNKKKFISRIQELLKVAKSGSFDIKTKDALSAFKISHELEDDSILDYPTFCLLIEANKFKASKQEMLEYGDYSFEVERLNRILSFLIKYLRLDIDSPHGMLYSKSTLNAVKALSNHFFNCKSVEELFYYIEYTYKVLSNIK